MKYVSEAKGFSRLALIAAPGVIAALVVGLQSTGSLSFLGPMRMLSITFMHVLWVQAIERQKPFSLALQPHFIFLAVALLVLAPYFFMHHGRYAYIAISLFIAVLCTFAFIPPRIALLRASEHCRLTAVALFAASLDKIYFFAKSLLWEALSNATAVGIRTLLRAGGIHTTSWSATTDKPGVFVKLPEFTMKILPECSGLEGIFLFYYLLALILLIDWRIFSRWSLTELYATGFVYMFLMNVLRIFSYMLFIRHVGYTDASARLIDLFHSNIGWVIYLAAFGIFMTGMYVLAAKTFVREPVHKKTPTRKQPNVTSVRARKKNRRKR